MKKILMICLLLITCLSESCKKDEGEREDSTNGIITFFNDLEGLNFVSACFEDWDCSKGLMINIDRVKFYSGAYNYDCITFSTNYDGGLYFFNNGTPHEAFLNYANYDRQKKLLTAHYYMSDYTSTNGTMTVSFYTKNKH